MNCDQVFDILTRGPFPTGTACDPPVEAHLSACPECRRLAEALRPALELFQESIGPEESRDLPGYWCAVATDRKQPVVSFAEEHSPRVLLPPLWHAGGAARGWSAITVWRMAAMLTLGLTLGSLVSTRTMFDGYSAPSQMTASLESSGGDEPPSRVPLTLAERTALAVLPAACTRHRPGSAPKYSLRGDQLLATADLGNLNCCSECHNSNSEAVPSAATAQVAQRCHLCHLD